MRRITGRRVLAGPGVLVAFVIVVGAVTAVTILRRSYTAVDGDLRLIGLDEAAEVARDSNGVPHINAQTAHDLFYLQGYVTASARPRGLGFPRRIGQARLSQSFG